MLDITWLQDANYAKSSGYDDNGIMNWDDSMEWVDSLEYYDSVRGITWNDWRLPDAHNQDGSGPDSGYNVTGSELGHLFYIELGNSANQGDYPFLGPFSVVLNTHDFYTRTENVSDVNRAWGFDFLSGQQEEGPKINEHIAWAVRDGDVATVPISGTVWLLGSGLIGLAGMRRFRKKYNLIL